MNNVTFAPVQTDQPSHLMPVFGRQQISFVRGQGSYLYTADGTEYVPEELERMGYGIVCCESGNIPKFMFECEEKNNYQSVKFLSSADVEDLEIRIDQKADRAGHGMK